MKMIIFSGHALLQMNRRGISEKEVREIIKNPGQTEDIHPGRIIMQSRILAGKPEREFLVRVFIDVSVNTTMVVTVYLWPQMTVGSP